MQQSFLLDHLLDKSVNLVSLLAEGAVLVKVVKFLSECSAPCVVELERPQEIGSSLEVRSYSVDLVDDVLYALKTSSLEAGGHDLVVAERHALVGHLSVSTLVDEFLDALQIGVAIGNVRLHQAKHLRGGGIHTHKHAVVDLAQAKELQDLLHLGAHVKNTTDADHEDQLLFRGNEDATAGLGRSTVVNCVLGDLKRGRGF